MGGDVSQSAKWALQDKKSDLYLKGEVILVTRVALHDS